MKTRILLLITAIVALSAGAFASERIVKDMNFGWKFVYGDPAGASAPDFDDSEWTVVNLPHDFQIAQPWVEPSADEKADLKNSVANVKSRLSARGFKEMGQGWYRLTFRPDESWRGRRVLLDFGGIMLTGDVWLNGRRIGGTDYGYLGFESDITDRLEYGHDNVIAVRADTGKPENSRWYTGGGLYRDAKIVVTDPQLYFPRHPLYITTPVVTDSVATVKIRAELANKVRKSNAVKVALTITDPSGSVVYDTIKDISTRRRPKIYEYDIDSITVVSPRLWDIDTPSLYTATVSLIDTAGNVADRVDTRFGIRSIEFSPEFGFKLNGRKVLLKGIANHHTLGALGAAAYPAAIEKRIRMLKDFGFNHIRSSHNPYSEEFLDLCDEYGILVVDELYDKWLTQYAGGRRDWMEQWPGDVTEWVKRDRNHPSVVIWSLGNELQTLSNLPFNDWGVTPYKLQKVLLERFDTTRPVTVAMHPRGRNLATDSLPAPLVMETDIASYNYRYMYFPGDSRRFPWMMFYQSEANTSGMGPNFYEMDLDKVIGLAYWGMIDYLGESAGWPAKGWTQGVFDIALNPKPMAWFLRSIFKDDEPVVGIGIIESDDDLVWNDVKVGTQRLSDHWNRRPGEKLNLYTFTNADEVELIVNGKSLGRRVNDKTDPAARNRIVWENVAYAPGYIEAKAYTAGNKKPVATRRIVTSGKPKRLVAEADDKEWKAAGMDLQHITVSAVDTKGNLAQDAEGLVTFTVDGPADIVGVINGDMTSPELTVGDSRSLYNGRVTVILRSRPSADSQKVTLRAATPTLTPATITLPLTAAGH